MINGSKSDLILQFTWSRLFSDKRSHFTPACPGAVLCWHPGKILHPEPSGAAGFISFSPHVMSYQSHPHPSLTWVWSRLSPAHLSFRNKSVKVEHHFQNPIWTCRQPRRKSEFCLIVMNQTTRRSMMGRWRPGPRRRPETNLYWASSSVSSLVSSW